VSELSKLNPDLGRKILSEAGFKVTQDGANWIASDESGKQIEMTILLRGTTITSDEMADWLTASGKKVGVKINCVKMEFEEFLRQQDEGIGQAYNAGWVMDYPDAQNMMQLLYSKNAVPQGINNSRYKSDAYDALYRQIAQLDSTNPEQLAKKKDLILQAHKIIDDDCPWAFVYFQKQYRLNHKWSLQAIPNDFNYSLFKYAHSDSDRRIKETDGWRKIPLVPAAIALTLIGALVVLFLTKVLRQA
jgi:ABC-type transport system substrate-binding protein